ncbi:hypothetical protein PMI07_006458 [Rhizobium sp. CF080]|uniref:ABC transporter substrate-binding protein n=1 Tax=Rhizobium sp. (strain CF080) TaxID=1144310 RepID=UPI0002717882|nr:extracellular solute-binding protein [Rhizobium sp. CF080]EUB98144.1 hypothetical protein PMI07_006458 [Rhizobium sp. CF080]
MMRSFKTAKLAFGALGLLLSAVPAFAADQALIDAANKEGKVVWYTSLVEDQAVRPIAKAFQAKYPNIKVEAVTGKVADLLLKINDELKVNKLQADVHHGGGTVAMLIAAGQVADYIPESAAKWPSEVKDVNGKWVAQVVSFLVPAYNTELIEEADAPKTYQDLLKPEFTGKIAWATQMTQGGPPGFIGTVLGVMGEEKGKEYLKALSKQKIINVPANQRVVLDQVIVGEYPLALATFSHHSDISAAQGAPVKWIPLAPMVTATADPMFLLKAAPHPNAGKLLIDFIASDEGQQVLAKANYIAANPALRDKANNPKAYALTPEDVGAHIKDWIKIYDELFK